MNGNGRRLWRSAEEFAGSEGFEAFLHREFPAGASELLATSRRSFLQVMGASLALAGAATVPGCRRPDHKILAYSKQVPEEVIPGKPLFYATSVGMPGGYALGVLVETHEGRPTKIEGNPLHPSSRGKSDAWAQASVLGLYDPDRLKEPVVREGGRLRSATWDDFRAWADGHFARFAGNDGEGLAFLLEKRSGFCRTTMQVLAQDRWKKAKFFQYDACEDESALAGGNVAFGTAVRDVLRLDRCRVVVSLDRDFLHQEAGSVRQAREWASTRRVLTAQDEMSRLYVVESGVSLAGGQADHRVRLSPGRVSAVALALGRAVLARVQHPSASRLASACAAVSAPEHGLDGAFIEAMAEDLVTNRGAGLVLAGPTQPAAVHALCHALNALLGNAGKTVTYLGVEPEMGSSSGGSLRELAELMRAGKVDTLVTMNVNPVYDAPGDLGFAELFGKVATTVSLSVDHTETASAATWSLNGAHALESWGDAESWDGAVSLVQPMIAPLYGTALSEVELLELLMRAGGEGGGAVSARPGYEIVKELWRGRVFGTMPPGSDFDRLWARTLHDGVAPETMWRKAENFAVNYGGVSSAVESMAAPSAAGPEGLDVVFAPGRLYDGRFANCSWLQELSDPATTVVWDNPALLSPATAARLGLTPDPYTVKEPSGRMCRVTVGGRSVELAAWVLPGMADDTVILPLGYGRAVCGLVGAGVGFDTNAARSVGSWRVGSGGRVERVAGSHPISSTQNHWTMEGRTSIVRMVDLAAWKKFGDAPALTDTDTYGNTKALNFAERLGELSHTPPNLSLYVNPQNNSKGEPAPGSVYSERAQWGMSIDLTTCTGCGVCTIACQSENNIPVVGKTEVRKGREMSWIRVDRYFEGDDLNAPTGMVFQPVACVHCENAPCETVCPVNATVHGPEGLNYMTYNRCIGTRYCANNCPYKVRRFNYFEYGYHKVNGSFMGEQTLGVAPTNRNLIPPRLREKLDEIERMRMNPDVTVRSRGVMEKCTYCVQRINAARIETKLHDLEHIPDGFFQAACQQACPSDSISFGDILDPASRVSAERNSQRSYLLLGFLNTRPRTTYMVRIANPNPALVDAARRASWDDPFHHGDHSDHGGHGGHGGEGDPGDHGDHDHGGAGEDGKHAAVLGRRRTLLDGGYALGLRVLGAVTGGVVS